MNPTDPGSGTDGGDVVCESISKTAWNVLGIPMSTPPGSVNVIVSPESEEPQPVGNESDTFEMLVKAESVNVMVVAFSVTEPDPVPSSVSVS